MRSNTLLKIDGIKIPKIKEYKVGRNKLWKDSTRNMNGDIRATLIGIFPKITIKFASMTETEMQLITSLLDKEFFNVTYFDPRNSQEFTAKYYAADFETEILSKNKEMYSPFDVSLIPVSKRRY